MGMTIRKVTKKGPRVWSVNIPEDIMNEAGWNRDDYYVKISVVGGGRIVLDGLSGR